MWIIPTWIIPTWNIPTWNTEQLASQSVDLNKMAVQYNVPNQVIEKFMERGKKLGFLAGHKNGNVITVSHLIIPIQQEFRPDIDHGIFLFKFR